MGYEFGNVKFSSPLNAPGVRNAASAAPLAPESGISLTGAAAKADSFTPSKTGFGGPAFAGDVDTTPAATANRVASSLGDLNVLRELGFATDALI